MVWYFYSTVNGTVNGTFLHYYLINLVMFRILDNSELMIFTVVSIVKSTLKE